MSKLLIIAFESHEAASLAGFAEKLGLPFDVVAIKGLTEAPSSAGTVRSAQLADIPTADVLAKALLPLVEGYTHIAAVSSMATKDVLARLAGLWDAAMVTDVTAVESPAQFQRPIFAGTVLSTVEVLQTPVVLTVRPSGFAKGNTATVEAETLPLDLPLGGTKRTAVATRGSARPDLSQAKVVVSGGRPLKDADTFEKVIGGLADALGGAVGATRAAVDSGIAANDLQVGQTGKIVAPDLYIAAGISGSTQHMAGIKDSKVIVAINNSPDAPIFEFADYGLVADLFDALPALTKKLNK